MNTYCKNLNSSRRELPLSLHPCLDAYYTFDIFGHMTASIRTIRRWENFNEMIFWNRAVSFWRCIYIFFYIHNYSNFVTNIVGYLQFLILGDSLVRYQKLFISSSFLMKCNLKKERKILKWQFSTQESYEIHN